MTSWWARWCLKSPASRLFAQPFIQGADQRKHQSSASLAFVRGIHRWPVNALTKRQQRGTYFHLMTSSRQKCVAVSSVSYKVQVVFSMFAKPALVVVPSDHLISIMRMPRYREQYIGVVSLEIDTQSHQGPTKWPVNPLYTQWSHSRHCKTGFKRMPVIAFCPALFG